MVTVPGGTVVVPAVAPARIDLRAFVRPGDTVLWGQGAGEPLTLTTALVDQAGDIGGLHGFVGLTYNSSPGSATGLRLRSYGALGAAAAMPVEVVGCHMSALPRLIRSRRQPADVVFCQVSPADLDGYHSLGVTVDYLAAALDVARVVVAEVNPHVPVTAGPVRVHASRFAAVVDADHPLIQVPDRAPSAVESRIAANVARLVPDGATLQLGIGGVAPAIAAALRERRELRVHSGLVGDWLVDLAEAGALAPDANPAVVAGTAVGTERLYRFVHRNPAVEMRPVEAVHTPAVSSAIPRFVAINAALQVDLSGQVNAEAIGGRWRGAIGGQVDFLRGAAAAPEGVGVIAVPSTAAGGAVSRIVPRLDGPVTTGRADVHWVVTEHGAADLRGLSAIERAEALCRIADPTHRAALAADAEDCPTGRNTS